MAQDIWRGLLSRSSIIATSHSARLPDASHVTAATLPDPDSRAPVLRVIDLALLVAFLVGATLQGR